MEIKTTQQLMDILNALRVYCEKQMDSEGGCEECLLSKSQFPQCTLAAPHEYDDFYIKERIKINKRKRI